MGYYSLNMAWSVDQIYGYLRFLVRKNQAGSISATEFFYAWNSEQNDFFQDLKGRFQARNNGKEGANTGLIENERIEIKLSPFIKTTTVAIAGGLGNRPADFSYLMAFRINDREVRHINKDQIASVFNNVIDPPSEDNNCYYFTPYQSQYKFLPVTVTSADIDYLASPIDVSWAYTLDGAGRQVYNPVSSVQPQWMQDEIIEITERTLKKFGLSYKDGDFAQYGNSVINTGS
jgi:hypothetical protein